MREKNGKARVKSLLSVLFFCLICCCTIVLFVLAQTAPSHVATPVLSAGDVSNGTSYNLTVKWNLTDADNEPFKNWTDWRLEGESYAVVNMPFEKNEQDGVNLKYMDYSLNSNNATETGTMNWLATGGHDGWGAYDFVEDSPKYLRIAPSDSLNGEQEALTISCWWKPHNLTIADGETAQIVARKNNTNGYVLQYARDDGKSTNSLLFRPNVESPAIGIKYAITNFNVDEWYHIAATLGDGSADIYVDGVEVASGAAEVDVPVVDALNITIGGADFEPNVLNATLDDCQIYYNLLTPEQLGILATPDMGTWSSEETAVGDNWTVAVIPFDNVSVGDIEVSNNLEVLIDPFVPNLDLSQTSQTRGQWELFDGDRLMHLDSSDAGAINFRQGFRNGEDQYGAEGAYTNTIDVKGKNFKVTHEISVNSSLATFLNSSTQYIMRIEANETLTIVNESNIAANDTARYFLKATLADSRASILIDYSAEASAYNISFNRVDKRTIDVYLTQNFSQYGDGSTVTIDPLIGPNEAPTHKLPYIIGAWVTSLFSDADDIEVTVENFTTEDTDADTVENIYSWWQNGQPMMLLNMPFAGNDDYASETYDYSGRGHDSDYFYGDPTYNETGGWDGQGAYEFDGKNDAIVLSNTNNSHYRGTNYTISVWIKANDIQGSPANFPVFLSKRSTNTNRDWTLFYIKSSERVNFQLFNASNFAYNPFTGHVAPIADDTWTHVVITREGSNFTMYLNTTLIKSNEIDLSIETDTNSSIVIGGSGTDLGGNLFWNGSIDDVMIFNRTLDFSEIQDLYTGDYNTLRPEATNKGDLIEATVTPNDGREDGTAKNVSRYINLNPTHNAPLVTKAGNWTLNSSAASDVEGDTIREYYSWVREDGRGMVLNVQFDRIGAAGFVSDYSSRGNNITKYDGKDLPPFSAYTNTWQSTPIFSATAGYDGHHAYNFNLNNEFPKQSFIIGKALQEPIVSAGSNFTLMSRFKSQDVSPTNSQGLVGYSDSNTGNKFGYHSYIYNGKLRCLISNNTDGRAFTSTTALQDDQWHHGACVFNGTSMALYLDGVLDLQGPVTLTGTFPANSSGSPFQGDVIGSLYHPNSFTMNGTIDDVQVWDVDLTAEQVDLIYRNKTNVLHENMIQGFDWTGYVTLNDGFGDSETKSQASAPAVVAAQNPVPGSGTPPGVNQPLLPARDTVRTTGEFTDFFIYYSFTEQPKVLTQGFSTAADTTHCYNDYNSVGFDCSFNEGQHFVSYTYVSDGEDLIKKVEGYVTFTDPNGDEYTYYAKLTGLNLNYKIVFDEPIESGIEFSSPYILVVDGEGHILGFRPILPALALTVFLLFVLLFIFLLPSNRPVQSGRGYR